MTNLIVGYGRFYRTAVKYATLANARTNLQTLVGTLGMALNRAESCEISEGFVESGH